MKGIEEQFGVETIADRVRQLGEQIRKDAGSGEVLLIGILKGSAVFLSDLMRQIDGHVTYAFIDVIRDMGDTGTAEAMEIDFLTHFAMQGKNLYLLKDVVSTGIIETYLMTQLRQHNPAELKLIALLDRPDLRTVDLAVDYRAFQVEGGTFVGYGLESQGRYGNLPYLATVSTTREGTSE